MPGGGLQTSSLTTTMQHKGAPAHIRTVCNCSKDAFHCNECCAIHVSEEN